jgi:hypothetical protein
MGYLKTLAYFLATTFVKVIFPIVAVVAVSSWILCLKTGLSFTRVFATALILIGALIILFAFAAIGRGTETPRDVRIFVKPAKAELGGEWYKAAEYLDLLFRLRVFIVGAIILAIGFALAYMFRLL